MTDHSTIPKYDDFSENWKTAVLELSTSGCSIVIDGDLIRIRKSSSSEDERIAPFIKFLRNNKARLMSDPGFLIEVIISEIDRMWIPEALEWMKRNRVDSWNKMLEQEQGINEAAKVGDIESLKKNLFEYRGLMKSMLEGCKKSPSDEIQIEIFKSSE